MKVKKIVMILAAASIAMCAFAQSDAMRHFEEVNAMTDGLLLDETSEGMIENPTPENSVLVYGACDAGTILKYADRKSKWEKVIVADHLCFILPPVHKGADMYLKKGGYLKHQVAGTRRYQTLDTWYSITNDEWNFKAPKDKSLLFIGFHSAEMPGSDTFEGMQIAWEKYKSENNVIGIIPNSQKQYDKYVTKMELSILKKLLKEYKGTDWEPVILERIAEVNEMLKKK